MREKNEPLRIRLYEEEMPPDHIFEDPNPILCHATGYETFCTALGQWMLEYISPDGRIYYLI